jgi:hypothetical protein
MAKPYCCKEAQVAPMHERGPAAMSDKSSITYETKNIERRLLNLFVGFHRVYNELKLS